MADVLQVEKRTNLGTTDSRRLRRSGRVPAVLYGHGESNEHLSVPNDDVQLLLRHHGRTVELKGDVNETALVADMQWDPLGIEVLHMDLMRVNLREKVDVTVALTTVGDAPGVREGGLLLENLHEVEIRCPAGDIPESVQLDVNGLGVGQHLTAGDVMLPEGAELVTPAETTVVHIEMPKTESEEAGEAGSGEPEVIAKGGEKDEE
ncbi:MULTISPECIES: 50S ribosomal protein L25 [Crateriforma]|uniref:Large ribosomal subunit protein bL25 n=1 Tax=Crateriforma conspicua TaxID=2527996 RepID=A0A5C6FX98_9PLAN|nr:MULTISPECIES: 50S ribosomal protein L25 [Crateriforma]TWU65948.1 50S ribosomal protein L25 [Crateriforma conspicua]